MYIKKTCANRQVWPQEIRALGRQLPALPQTGMQRAVRAMLRRASPALAVLDPEGPDPVETLAPSSSTLDAAQERAAGFVSSSSASSTGRETDVGGAVMAAADASRALVPVAEGGGAEERDAVLTLSPATARVKAGDLAGAARGSADLDGWILQNLNGEAARKARVDALVALARPFSYTRLEALQTLGNLYAHNVA